MFETVTILGTGLIGSSFGGALLKNNLAKKVIGVDLSHKRAKQAKTLGFVTHTVPHVESVLPRSDLVVLAMPVGLIHGSLSHVARDVSGETLVIDVGSTKGLIVREADRHFKNGNFVGCHPMAGSELWGPEGANADLFNKKKCFVVPAKKSRNPFVKKTTTLWRRLGAKPERMGAHEHDRIMALVSHLPHLVSSALAASFTGAKMKRIFQEYAGRGWRDTTRVAASDHTIWTMVFEQNQKNLLSGLREFRCLMNGFEKAIASRNWKEVSRLLQRSAAFRREMDKS